MIWIVGGYLYLLIGLTTSAVMLGRMAYLYRASLPEQKNDFTAKTLIDTFATSTEEDF